MLLTISYNLEAKNKTQNKIANVLSPLTGIQNLKIINDGSGNKFVTATISGDKTNLLCYFIPVISTL